ncbi:MAG: beta-N-acetylhexosaminidase [Cycloclasticus sp. symbiont of Poecilosclerida sp. M]|nr:MAG: beta-N-acetylhexosaminidase [Cycloclasticus sp. symbiont of Poecilosclerida sp. M]
MRIEPPQSLGPLMVDIEGLSLTQVDKELLCNPQVGGVIFFSRNYESVEQLTHLCDEIHQLRSPSLLIAVDHEGGRVQRFRQGFTAIPCMQKLGGLYVKDPQAALDAARETAWLMAAELREVGVDFSFAPVLDIDYGCSEIIGDRSFSSDKKIIAEIAAAFHLGLQDAGMASVGKHFPGHGAVAPDSHIALPVDTREFDEIFQHDIYPFQQLITSGMHGIMPAHVVYETVDSLPVGFSEFWLQNVLRQRLKFEGVIFSDDLSMHGASVIGDFAQRAKQAFSAGCDMALVCNDRAAVEAILNTIGSKKLTSDVSIARLEKMRPSIELPLNTADYEAKKCACLETIKDLA